MSVLLQVICSGAVVAAGFTLAKYLEIQKLNDQFFINNLINTFIDGFSPDVRKMIQAVVAVAIVSGVFIPLEIIVILLRLLGISLGKLGRVIVILVISLDAMMSVRLKKTLNACLYQR